MAAFILLATLALACEQDQSTPPPAKAAPSTPASDTAVSGVVVNAAKPDVQTSIDRRSYAVANDLSGQTGSIADVLRNIPSVQVDVQGNLSLRGDGNVTVLVDGQPSSQFKGDSLAQALQSMPANRIDRIEVMTNPSAEFRPEGSGGIINLVTKKAKGAGPTGSLLLSARNDGGYSASLSGGFNSNKLSLTGDVAYRRLDQDSYTDERRSEADTVNGGSITSQELFPQIALFNFGSGHAAADYDVDARTRVTFDLRASYGDRTIRGDDLFEMDNGLGQPTLTFDRRVDTGVTLATGSVSTTWRRRFGDGHDLALNFNFDDQEQRLGRFESTTTAGVPAGERLVLRDVYYRQSNWRGDYNRPMIGKAKLKLGFDFGLFEGLLHDDGGESNAATPVTRNPAFANRFHLQAIIDQAYATYEKPLGKVTVLGGLRAELVDLDLNQQTMGVRSYQDYARLFPSLHLAYALGGGRQATASYSRRINRPLMVDINAFRYSSTPQQYIAGNPNLKPENVDSFELGYETRKGPRTFLATLYYRRTTDALTTVATDLGGGVLMAQRANAGQRQTGGMEVVKTGQFIPKLTYNLSADFYWAEIEGPTPGGLVQQRSATTGYGRANLNWQITSQDFVQLNVFVNGKVLYPQGYGAPTASGNIGYRHKVSDRLSWMLVAQDPFATLRNRLVLNLPTKVSREERSNSRLIIFSLVRTFGGGKTRDPNFDFTPGGNAGG